MRTMILTMGMITVMLRLRQLHIFFRLLYIIQVLSYMPNLLLSFYVFYRVF